MSTWYSQLDLHGKLMKFRKAKNKKKLIIEMDTVKTAQSREVVGWFGRGI